MLLCDVCYISNCSYNICPKPIGSNAISSRFVVMPFFSNVIFFKCHFFICHFFKVSFFQIVIFSNAIFSNVIFSNVIFSNVTSSNVYENNLLLWEISGQFHKTFLAQFWLPAYFLTFWLRLCRHGHKLHQKTVILPPGIWDFNLYILNAVYFFNTTHQISINASLRQLYCRIGIKWTPFCCSRGFVLLSFCISSYFCFGQMLFEQM